MRVLELLRLSGSLTVYKDESVASRERTSHLKKEVQHNERDRIDETMDAHLLRLSVAEQRVLLQRAGRTVKNIDKRAGYITQLLDLVEDEEELADYAHQLRKIQKERKCATEVAAMVKEHLKQANVRKLEAELHRAVEELAEEEQKAAKKKADETAATKAKAARRRANTAEAAARAAVENSDVEHHRRIWEEQAADQAAVQHMDKQAATKMKSVDKVHIVAKQKTGNTMQGSCRSSKMSSPPNYGR